MTTVQIQLPDELAHDAQVAGLLAPEVIERLLRDQLKKQAGQVLRDIWARLPREKLTPEIEKMIHEEVEAVRAERRRRASS